MTRYDSIVIGGGHNGLTCASYLARGGHKVLLLEASDSLGGLARTSEFHPGYKASLATGYAHFSQRVANDLSLQRHGLGPQTMALRNVALASDGNHLVATEDSLSGTGHDDVAAFDNYNAQMKRFGDMMAPFWEKTVPRLGGNTLQDLFSWAQLGLRMRLLGKDDMGEFLRMVTLPMYDLMDEHFSSPALKAMLCWDGLIGSRQAPRTPNNAVLQLLYRRRGGTAAGCQQVPAGGISALISALEKSARNLGVTVMTGSAVASIDVDGDTNGQRITGVTTDNGEHFSAPRVVSSADPFNTFVRLLGVRHLEIEFTNRIRRIRNEGLVARMHVALDGLPGFNNLENPDGRLFTAPDMETIEIAYDHAKYGELPPEPALEIVVPSLHEPTLAPEGHHVMAVNILYVPLRPKGGWDDAARQSLTSSVLDTIARFAPGIRDHWVATQLLTPTDIETGYLSTGGHWHHGDLALDQMFMMRPTYGAAQFNTPVPGLFLCGAGSHPGGDLTGIPGQNAAREILS